MRPRSERTAESKKSAAGGLKADGRVYLGLRGRIECASILLMS